MRATRVRMCVMPERGPRRCCDMDMLLRRCRIQHRAVVRGRIVEAGDAVTWGVGRGVTLLVPSQQIQADKLLIAVAHVAPKDLLGVV